MKKLSVLAVLAASITFCGFRAAAQPPATTAMRPSPAAAAPMRSAPPIALLDVGHIFKEHYRFKSSMNELKAKVKQAEDWVKSEKEAIRKMTEDLQRFESGTLEYKQLEEQIAGRVAQVETRIKLSRRDFLQEEAKRYHSTYREIESVVNYYVSTNGVGLVLRFSRTPVDPNNPQAVITMINKPVVGYNAQLDITDWVLSQCNRDTIRDARRPTPPPGPTPVPFNRH